MTLQLTAEERVALENVLVRWFCLSRDCIYPRCLEINNINALTCGREKKSVQALLDHISGHIAGLVERKVGEACQRERERCCKAVLAELSDDLGPDVCEAIRSRNAP